MQPLQSIGAIIRRDDAAGTIAAIGDESDAEPQAGPDQPGLPAHIETFLAALRTDWRQGNAPDWNKRFEVAYLAQISGLSKENTRKVHYLLLARHDFRPSVPDVAAAVADVVPAAEILPGHIRDSRQSAQDMRRRANADLLADQDLSRLALESAEESGKTGRDFAREGFQRLRASTPLIDRQRVACTKGRKPEEAFDFTDVDLAAMAAKREQLRRQAAALQGGQGNG